MMEKIIFIGSTCNGKTYLTKAIVSQNRGVILCPDEEKQLIKEAVEFCERIAFEGFHDHKFIKQILSKDTAYNLTHVLCTFQEEPEWLTPVFVKKHNIKVFYLNRIPYVLP